MIYTLWHSVPRHAKRLRHVLFIYLFANLARETFRIFLFYNPFPADVSYVKKINLLAISWSKSWHVLKAFMTFVPLLLFSTNGANIDDSCEYGNEMKWLRGKIYTYICVNWWKYSCIAQYFHYFCFKWVESKYCKGFLKAVKLCAKIKTCIKNFLFLQIYSL